MNVRKKEIEFTAIYEEQAYVLHTYKNEYRHLMSLLNDLICPDDFGQCGGQGKCGTCLVEVLSKTSYSEKSHRNQHTTLKKMGVVNPNVRLSCQVLIGNELKDANIRILDHL